ncbi:BTAD domain-containing putative transcriptional regulator [Pseudonocardia phyllosphaerae]|uniref:BTAD domain-containing putative transcriptional regulator n=1 Tax=Pseudonocardia phyllosphaerae TaxID=3390502 RepID=UPI0039780DFA
MSIRLLGPVSVRDADGRELLPAGPRVQGLLARLALDAGRVVDAATLVDALWGATPPSTANALQSLASRLRRALGADRVRSSSGGYLLDVGTDEVDALRFAALRRAAAAEPGDDRARALLTEALGLWQGPALGGLRELPFADAAAARLADTRAAVAEELAARGLASGVPDAGRDTLTGILDEQPLRETTAVALARGLHAGGRRADALAVLDRTRAALADELGVDPGPELRRARTELLHDSTAPASPAPAPAAPARTPSRPRTLALTSFVGRDDDLARLRDLVATSRLVTVTGPGGAGKTRLSAEALRDLERPVAVAELAALTGADQVVATVLHAVGGAELALGELGGPDLLARLRATLSGRELVLVLDNCEHLIDAAAELVHELLTTVPGLVVLATSREPLGVPGEVLHPLGALDDAHATRLFAERAAAVRPGFALDRHTAVVRDICRRLDGQPLPIELAAARVRSMEPEEIAERLADRFRLLVGGARTVLPRHQTLRAVVDWSWELLSPAEDTLATRFGVFAGAVDARTVEAVCAGPGLPDAFDVLGALVEKSLVVTVPDADGPTRYRMLETIREYAAARLETADDRDAVVGAHAVHVLAVLEPGEPRLRGPEQLDQLVVVRRIEGEAVRALERAVADGATDHAHRLLAALLWSWVMRGDMTTMVGWIERVIARLPPPVSPAGALNRAMHAVTTASYDDRMASDTEVAAVTAMRTELARPWHPVVELVGPTAHAFTTGDRGELLALLDDPARDPWLRAAAGQVAAVHAENVGDLQAQRRCLRSAHELFTLAGDRFGLGMTTFALGELEDQAGDRTAARAAYTEAVALADALRNVDDVPQYRLQLASLAAREGDEAGAREQLRLAEENLHDVTAPGAGTWLTWFRADIERVLGNPGLALELIAATEGAVTDGPGRTQRQAVVHQVAGAALTDLGRYDEARDRLEAAAKTAAASEDGPVLAQVAESVARWALLTGDAERAGELLGLALDRRGMLHLGRPDVVSTRDGVLARLGPDATEAAYERGRATPRSTPPVP